MDLTILTFEELKTLADSIEGFKYHPNSKEETLRANLGKYLEEHPEVIGDDQGDKDGTPETDTTDASLDDSEDTNPDTGDDSSDENETPEGLVKIKAETARGVVNSSFGPVDFGTDGIAEVSPEIAELFCDKIPKGYDRC
jgi:hypothetical protein